MSSALGLLGPAPFNQFLDLLNALAFFVSNEILRVREALNSHLPESGVVVHERGGASRLVRDHSMSEGCCSPMGRRGCRPLVCDSAGISA